MMGATGTRGGPADVAFVKMHAAGNAFVLVDALDGLELDWPRLAIETADPHFAVGHDGLLVVMPGEAAEYRQRMFNPDGTEDMCGNGLRCVAKYLHDAGRIVSTVVLETIGGRRTVEWLRVSGPTAHLRSGLGTPAVRHAALRLGDLPRSAAAAVPTRHTEAIESALATALYVSLGTPHIVLHAGSELPEATWEALSAALEQHALGDERTSVTWFRRTGRERLAARFWERAVGETLACGTGAGASIVAARRAGLVGAEAAVITKGGEVRASWDGEGEVFVEGPATTVFTGRWPSTAYG